MTLNEPSVFIQLGHGDGIHAPGLKLALEQELRAAHRALLAHGKGAQALRAGSKKPGQVGIALVGGDSVPASDDPADAAAAKARTWACAAATCGTTRGG